MSYNVDPMTGNGTQSVIVAEPCTCSADRWFYCACPVVARYEVDVFDGAPLKEHIEYIWAQHPGKTLIY
jgi:hypothetical protein